MPYSTSFKRRCFFFIVLLPFLWACGDNNVDHKYYTVEKTNYQNVISTSGILEAERSVSIICPRLHTDLTILTMAEDGAIVEPGDTVCILEAAEIENRYINSLKDLEIAKVEYQKVERNLALQTILLESQVRSIETTTDIRSLDSLQMQFTSEAGRKIIELELQKAKLEKQKIENKLHFLKTINESELAKLKLRIKQARNRVDRAKGKLDQLVLISEWGGIIQRARKWSGEMYKEGDVVWSSSRPILTIPNISTLQVKLKVSEAHFKRINKKQKTQMVVDAFPEEQITGVVLRKSGGGKPVSRGSKVKLYDVAVKIDSLIGDYQPGLSVTCDIILEEYSDTLAVPLTCVFDSDSSRVVFVKHDNYYTQQDITIVAESPTMAVVSGGVETNDIITTFRPSTKKIK